MDEVEVPVRFTPAPELNTVVADEVVFIPEDDDSEDIVL